MRWFWLSFADPDLPEGSQFLGAIIIDVSAKDIEMLVDVDDRAAMLRGRGQEEDLPFYCATMRCHLLGINPGGECRGGEIPTDLVESETTPEQRRRLISFEEMQEIGWEPVRMP